MAEFRETTFGELAAERAAELETPKKKRRKSRLTIEQIMAAVEADDCLGFCIACGAEQGGCEPDACDYECESCGAMKVFGAEELLIMGFGD